MLLFHHTAPFTDYRKAFPMEELLAHTPSLAGEFCLVSEDTFGAYFTGARSSSPIIGEMTSEFTPSGNPDDVYRVSLDGLSGYAVRNGELVYVFSIVKGRGDSIVRKAISDGASELDCFDGYLPVLYGRHGFEEVRREANWTPGAPDVVYMSRPLIACHNCGATMWATPGTVCEDCR